MSAIAAHSSFHASSPSNGVLAMGVFASIALHGSVIVLVPEAQWKTPAASEVKVLTATLGPLPAKAQPEPVPPVEQQPLRWPPEPFLAEAAKPSEPSRPALARPSQKSSSPRAAESVAPARPTQESPVPRTTQSVAAETPIGESVAPPASPQMAGFAAIAPIPELPRAWEATQRPGRPSTVVATAPTSVPQQIPQTPRAADQADVGTVDQYRLSLMGQARRYKRYPSQAVEKGWTGKVEVRLVVGADGNMQGVLVKSSSGYAILDNQAIDIVKKAKPLTPIPRSLRGREFSVDIPVIFDLTG